MMWIVSLIVLALLAWFVYRTISRNALSRTAASDPLEHDRGEPSPPPPGRHAPTDGEVEVIDAARTSAGGSSGAHPGGAPARDGAPAEAGAGDASVRSDAGRATDDVHRVEASVRTQPEPPDGSASITDGFGEEGSARTVVPGSPDPAADDAPDAPDTAAADPERRLDASAAARAAEASRDTGGTGAAVLAGIATTGGVAADERDGDDDGRGEPIEPSERANAPDADTAGALDVERSRAAAEAPTPAADDAHGSPDAVAGAPSTPAGDAPTGVRDPARDDARTNAPIADTDAGSAAREPLDAAGEGTPATDVAEGAAGRASADIAPEERANAPDADTAGAGALADRSIAARSNLVAGTVSLGVGGATVTPGAAVLEDGRTPAERAARLDGGASLPGDAERLADGDGRTNVREMMKILNLRESDASRLGISTDDFGRLWRGDVADDAALVDDVGSRLRRMLG